MPVHRVADEEKLETLDPTFKPVALKIVAEMQQHGWKLRIVWGRRTKKENDLLVQQGVASKASLHLDGKAVDLIDRAVGYSEDRDHKFYKDLKAACEKHGAKWGGSFATRWDPTHFEAVD